VGAGRVTALLAGQCCARATVHYYSQGLPAPDSAYVSVQTPATCAARGPSSAQTSPASCEIEESGPEALAVVNALWHGRSIGPARSAVTLPAPTTFRDRSISFAIPKCTPQGNRQVSRDCGVDLAKSTPTAEIANEWKRTFAP